MPIIAYSEQGDVALLELCAPRANAISFALLGELGRALRRAHDDPRVSGIVIHGGTERFSVGADLAIFRDIRRGDEAVFASRVFQETFQEIEDSSKPVIAALAGHVLGGGLELAMSCHGRLAAEQSRFSMPEVNLGINPGAGGTQRLPRLIGLEAALDMLLSGRTIDAQTALQWGLIDATCPPEELIQTAVNLLSDGSSRLSRAMRNLATRRTGRRRDRLADAEANRGVLARGGAQAAKVRAELVAPGKILEAVRVGVEESFEAGLLREREAFRQCMDSLGTRNKIYLLCAKGQTARLPELQGVKGVRLGRVGVLGMGAMGTGIAQALLMAGLHVTACDQNDAALQGAAVRIADSLERQVAQGKLPAAKARAALTRLTTTPDWRSLAGATLIVEAVVEDVGEKLAAIARLEEICLPETIIATTTSTINLDVLAAGMHLPDRVIGLHFLHPAQRMPLVEVIRRSTTPPEVVATALALAKAIGKTPVVATNREGFVVNRLLLPYLTEAFWLLEEGAEPEAVDRAMVDFGFDMGPLQLIDMSGVDILAKAQPILSKAFPWHGGLSPIVWELVARGHLGQKTGAGIYQYVPGDATPMPHREAEQIIAGVRRRRSKPSPEPDGPDIVVRLMLRMVAEAFRLLEDGVVRRPADVDVAMVLGTGLADFRGGVLKYATDLGLENVLETLPNLAEQHGPRYSACSLLEKVARGSLKLTDTLDSN
jgi:3-hydroxyacyl-CoA dehydrogenase